MESMLHLSFIYTFLYLYFPGASVDLELDTILSTNAGNITNQVVFNLLEVVHKHKIQWQTVHDKVAKFLPGAEHVPLNTFRTSLFRVKDQQRKLAKHLQTEHGVDKLREFMNGPYKLPTVKDKVDTSKSGPEVHVQSADSTPEPPQKRARFDSFELNVHQQVSQG